MRGGGVGKKGKLVKRGGREDPATPVIPGLVYGHQWPARSQCSTTLLQRLVDSAEWEITHQELTFKIWGRRRREEEGRSVGDKKRADRTSKRSSPYIIQLQPLSPVATQGLVSRL
ncbi:hypothetical protein Q5P01_007264 [Channa striata]|uniref:Uncharacterized protein n=1 Tax=Channa striata TaxID=64152 RepID=A0AA88N642_CHASR|nr:hypothetical protein Q5P01_007264 [Channa striata]